MRRRNHLLLLGIFATAACASNGVGDRRPFRWQDHAYADQERADTASVAASGRKAPRDDDGGR